MNKVEIAINKFYRGIPITDEEFKLVVDSSTQINFDEEESAKEQLGTDKMRIGKESLMREIERLENEIRQNKWKQIMEGIADGK